MQATFSPLIFITVPFSIKIMNTFEEIDMIYFMKWKLG